MPRASRPKTKKSEVVSRDPERSRARILSAATQEFAARGYAGARVDAIAKRARINKRMLYHYFGNKRDLFRATVVAIHANKQEIIEAGPPEIEELLPYIHAHVGARRDWNRMMQWEALSYSEREIPAEKERARLFRSSVARVRRFQREHGLLAGEKPEFAMLALMALASYPWLMPQVARMVTGRGPTDPGFQKAYSALLRRMVRYLMHPRIPPVI